MRNPSEAPARQRQRKVGLVIRLTIWEITGSYLLLLLPSSHRSYKVPAHRQRHGPCCQLLVLQGIVSCFKSESSRACGPAPASDAALPAP